MIDTKDGVQFDPGFIQHISAFEPNIQYVYNSLSTYKNFNQKKLQFKMYYPKIQSLLKNYIGFYFGCILWAICIKKYENTEVLNNLCFGGEYSETDTLEEVDFIKNYIEQLKKDAKYYIGQTFEIDADSLKILDLYREFLALNEGFVKVKTTDDIKIPTAFKKVADTDEIQKEIEKVIDNGKLYELLPLSKKVL